MRELGKRDSSPACPARNSPVALLPEFVALEVEIRWPGHIFYLFNYVSQQNLIVNKEEILLYFSNSLHLDCLFCHILK